MNSNNFIDEKTQYSLTNYGIKGTVAIAEMNLIKNNKTLLGNAIWYKEID